MLKFQRADLSDCFDRAAKIAGKRSPRELTRMVLIDAADNRATVTATDCEVGIRLSCPCEGPPMKALVPGVLMAGFLRSMSGTEVTLDLDADRAVLTDGVATFRPPTADPETFVGWQTPENSVSLDAHRFAPAVRRTAWSADEEGTRYALGGVLVVLRKGECELAATDSRCLAVESFATESDAVWSGVVPSYAITAAAPLMAGSFTLHYSDKAVEFEGIDSSYYSRLVEGRFPDYSKVIPRGKFACELVLACNDMARLVSQALMVTSEETRGVDFEVTDRLLWAKCGSETKGVFAGKLPVSFDGQAGATLDPQFLRDFLGKLEPDAKLHWGVDVQGANLFTCEGLSWLCVVMPLARD